MQEDELQRRMQELLQQNQALLQQNQALLQQNQALLQQNPLEGRASGTGDELTENARAQVDLQEGQQRIMMQLVGHADGYAGPLPLASNPSAGHRTEDEHRTSIRSGSLGLVNRGKIFLRKDHNSMMMYGHTNNNIEIMANDLYIGGDLSMTKNETQQAPPEATKDPSPAFLLLILVLLLLILVLLTDLWWHTRKFVQ